MLYGDRPPGGVFPVKNKSGSDSPLTAQESMVALHRNWLQDAGITIPSGRLVEISPLYTLDKEEVISKQGELFNQSKKIPTLDKHGKTTHYRGLSSMCLNERRDVAFRKNKR